MAISASNLIFRSPRRVRVLFSNTLGVGAFVTSNFTVTSTDSRGADPVVLAALIVADTPTAVELALDAELVEGSGYAVNVAAGVPAADASVTAAPVSLPLRTPGTSISEAVGPAFAALDRLYGIDLAYDGSDFVEGPDGDLLTVRGEENVKSALERRALSEGLSWRPDYGVKLRQHIDEPEASIGAVRADLVRQMRRDDRVTSATARLSTPTDVAGEFVFELDAELLAKRQISSSLALPKN